MPDAAERTQPVTPRRRQWLRERGVVARSPALTALSALLGAVVATWLAGGFLFAELERLTLDTGPMTFDARELLPRLLETSRRPLLLVALVGVGGVLGAVVGTVMQTGVVWSPAAIQPNPQRLNPLSALAGIGSPARVVQIAIHWLCGLLALGWATWSFTAQRDLWLTLGLTPSWPWAALSRAIASLGLGCVVCFALAGLLEYAVARWQLNRSTRLTRQEHRDELREAEGDPQLRSRRRAFYARVLGRSGRIDG